MRLNKILLAFGLCLLCACNEPPVPPVSTVALAPDATQTNPSPTTAPSPTPDIIATRRDAGQILNADPQTFTAGDLIVNLTPTADLKDLALEIIRPDRIIFQSTVVMLLSASTGYEIDLLSNVNVLTIQDLDGDGELEILFGVGVYGLGCCTSHFIVFYEATAATYFVTNAINRSWGIEPELVDIEMDGQPELLTRNEPFAFKTSWDAGYNTEQFTPLQILRYANGAIVDVTHEYPELVQDDAAYMWAAATGQEVTVSEQFLKLTGRDPDSARSADLSTLDGLIFTAYMADMIQLGQTAAACQAIQQFCSENEGNFCTDVRIRYQDEPDFCTAYSAEIETALEVSQSPLEYTYKSMYNLIHAILVGRIKTQQQFAETSPGFCRRGDCVRRRHTHV